MKLDTFDNLQDYVNAEISIRKKLMLSVNQSAMFKTSNQLLLRILQA